MAVRLRYLIFRQIMAWLGLLARSAQGKNADAQFGTHRVLSTVSMHTLLMSLPSMLRLSSSPHESDTDL